MSKHVTLLIQIHIKIRKRLEAIVCNDCLLAFCQNFKNRLFSKQHPLGALEKILLSEVKKMLDFFCSCFWEKQKRKLGKAFIFGLIIFTRTFHQIMFLIIKKMSQPHIQGTKLTAVKKSQQ